MKHYSILLVVQDHVNEIPGLFLVSILETEPHDSEELDTNLKVSSFERFLIAWDGTNIDFISRHGTGTPGPLPEESSFDIIKVLKAYLEDKD